MSGVCVDLGVVSVYTCPIVRGGFCAPTLAEWPTGAGWGRVGMRAQCLIVTIFCTCVAPFIILCSPDLHCILHATRSGCVGQFAEGGGVRNMGEGTRGPGAEKSETKTETGHTCLLGHTCSSVIREEVGPQEPPQEPPWGLWNGHADSTTRSISSVVL